MLDLTLLAVALVALAAESALAQNDDQLVGAWGDFSSMFAEPETPPPPRPSSGGGGFVVTVVNVPLGGGDIAGGEAEEGDEIPFVPDAETPVPARLPTPSLRLSSPPVANLTLQSDVFLDFGNSNNNTSSNTVGGGDASAAAGGRGASSAAAPVPAAVVSSRLPPPVSAASSCGTAYSRSVAMTRVA